MDQMINKDLVKKLRNERAWSQEQLSAVSGLSLRTVQRIFGVRS
ncbi:helix-turn-helix domain-containing protein [Pseudoalteromonas xiamenensis]